MAKKRSRVHWAAWGIALLLLAAVTLTASGRGGNPAGRRIAAVHANHLLPPGWEVLGATTVGWGTEPGSIRLSFGPAYWGGIVLAHLPSPNYTADAVGRVIAGRGWGLAARVVVGSDGQVTGHAVQYDPGAGGRRDVDYPSDTGPTTEVASDTNWHHLAVMVRAGTYELFIDGTQYAHGALPPREASGGVFVRVWSGAIAEVRDLTVRQL